MSARPTQLVGRCPLRRAGAILAVAASLVVVTKLFVLPLRRALANRRFQQSLTAQKDGVVYLYGFPRPKSAMNLSIPVLKVEVFMRLNRIPFEYRVGSFDQSPTGRVPFIAYKGTLLAESDVIIDFLKVEFGVTMDATLTPEQHATGHAVRRMLEMHAYPCSMRCFMVNNTSAFKELIGREMSFPKWLLPIMMRSMRKNVIASLNMNGIGDLTDEQCWEQHSKDVQSIAQLLSGGTFLFGSKPSSYDCAVFAYLYVTSFIDGALVGAVPSRVHQFIRDNARIAAFMRGFEHCLRE